MKPYGIPTKYGFINFRSRLEARWAAFFDALGFEWQYEPFDLPGWIPDFSIIGPRGTVLVEVKPYSQAEEFRREIESLDQHCISTKTDILLVGQSPFLWRGSVADVVLGEGLIYYPKGGDCEPKQPEALKDKFILGRWMGRGTDNGPEDEWVSPTLHFGIADDYLSYADKLSGAYDGGRIRLAPLREEIEPLWAAACNTTQWHAVTPR